MTDFEKKITLIRILLSYSQQSQINHKLSLFLWRHYNCQYYPLWRILTCREMMTSMICYQANPYNTADKICFSIVKKGNFIYSDLLFGSKVEMSQFQKLISKLDFTKSNLLELKPSDLKACSSLNTNCLYILFISIL